MISEIIKKIEFQSILVLLITLVFGYFLLRIDNTLKSPAGILGMISIAFGILYTLISFISNQIRENYKDVIQEYKSTITTLKSGHSFVEKRLNEAASQSSTSAKASGYKTMETLDTGTSAE